MIQGDAETVAMVEELIGRAELAAIRTTNMALEAIFKESQVQVPKGPPSKHEKHAEHNPDYPERTLAESGRIELATPESPTGMVIYDSPYAAAQEAGIMPFVGPEGDISWHKAPWEVERHTTEGTKSHYLEDPAKLILAQIPEEVAVQGRIAFRELPGPIMAKSTLQSSGHRVEQMAPPGGEVAAIMRQETTEAQRATTFRTPTAPPTLQ